MTGIDPVLVEARPVLRHADNRGRERLFVGTIDEFDLVIVELTDRCFAVEDRCPHRSARFSKLGRLVNSRPIRCLSAESTASRIRWWTEGA